MLNTKFDSKSFNPEAFGYKVGHIPNLKTNELKKSAALAGNPDIKKIFASQNGTEYARIAQRGLADGDAVNYDGQTDITATSTKTFEKGVVVVGRAKGWVEKDFSFDITGGVDFMDNISKQVADYKDNLDQNTLLAILKGIYSMTGAKNLEFVEKHTTVVNGNLTATTVNSATNKACGANKKKFRLFFVHSDVATNLENLNLLEYMKYTDKDGITRELAIGTCNGKIVIIDDEMPTEHIEASEAVIAVAETKGVYTLTVTGAAIEDDKLEISFGDTKVVTYLADGAATAASVAGTVRTMCKGCTALTDVFDIAGTGAAITFTQKVGGTGATPTVTCTQTTSGTIAASFATTTEGVAAVAAKAAVEEHTLYTSYVLGEGAFDYEDVGVKKPYEMARNATKNGGEDTLIMRQRKCFSPKGISYEKVNQATDSPVDSELEDGANWSLVHSGEANEESRSYIDHKAIPIVRIISRG